MYIVQYIYNFLGKIWSTPCRKERTLNNNKFQILGVAKSDLQITHGMKTKDKTISIASACFRRGKDTGSSEDIVALVKEKLLRQESIEP